MRAGAVGGCSGGAIGRPAGTGRTDGRRVASVPGTDRRRPAVEPVGRAPGRVGAADPVPWSRRRETGDVSSRVCPGYALRHGRRPVVRRSPYGCPVGRTDGPAARSPSRCPVMTCKPEEAERDDRRDRGPRRETRGHRPGLAREVPVLRHRGRTCPGPGRPAVAGLPGHRAAGRGDGGPYAGHSQDSCRRRRSRSGRVRSHYAPRCRTGGRIRRVQYHYVTRRTGHPVGIPSASAPPSASPSGRTRTAVGGRTRAS